MVFRAFGRRRSPERRSAGRRCRPCRGCPDRRGARLPAAGTSRSGRRPCGAGRWSGGSAARSRRSSRGESRRAAPSGCRTARRRAPGSGRCRPGWRRSRSATGWPGGLFRAPARAASSATARPHRRRHRRLRPTRMCEDGAGVGLRFLDVRLIERIDPQDGARERGRDLPAHELGAELDRRVDGDADDRVAGGGQLGQPSVHVRADGRVRSGRAGQRDPDEDAVVAVGRTARRAARRRPETTRPTVRALPVLSAMSCSTQGPKAASSRSMTKVSLSRPLLREDAHRHAQGKAGVVRPGRRRRRR